jgi:hypothetical protein
MIMTTDHAFGADKLAPNNSLTALLLLTDPVSTLLERDRLLAITGIAFRRHQGATRRELTLLRDCYRDLRWLRQKLKLTITVAYAWGIIDAATAQRHVDRFELWSD